MNCLVDETTDFNRSACNQFLHFQITSRSQQNLSLVPACTVYRNCYVYISCQWLLQKTTGEYETSLSVYSIFSTRGADKSLARPGGKQATATNSNFCSISSTRGADKSLARPGGETSYSDKLSFCSISSTRGADKSLARPGGKQATATNSNFCKPLKNNSEGCPSNQVSAAAMTSALDEKLRPFNCFFSRVGLRTY